MTLAVVRMLEAGDRQRWEQLFRGYVTFYETSVPDDVVDLTWQRLIAREDGMVGFAVLDETAQIQGLAHLTFHRSTWSPTWYCYLEDLFVDPAVRSSGFGRALIEATYAEADRRGATRTYWVTQEKNATARQLYDQLARLEPFVQYRR